MLALRIRPRVALRAYGERLVRLRAAILMITPVLALAYVMNLSGQTVTIGLWAAGAGGMFALISLDRLARRREVLRREPARSPPIATRRYRTNARSGSSPLSASSLTYLAALPRPTPAAVPVLVFPLICLLISWTHPTFRIHLSCPPPTFLPVWAPTPLTNPHGEGAGVGAQTGHQPLYASDNCSPESRIRDPGSSPGVNPHPRSRPASLRATTPRPSDAGAAA
jgi:hypothetical protein